VREGGWPLDFHRGWYDVEGCGVCNTYCQWVGFTVFGGNPAFRLTHWDNYWSCRLISGESTPKGYFTSWSYPKCARANAEDEAIVGPWVQETDLDAPVLQQAHSYHVNAAHESYSSSNPELNLQKDSCQLVDAYTQMVVNMTVNLTSICQTADARRQQAEHYVMRSSLNTDLSGAFELGALQPPIDTNQFKSQLSQNPSAVNSVTMSRISDYEENHHTSSNSGAGGNVLPGWFFGVVCGVAVLAGVSVLVAGLVWQRQSAMSAGMEKTAEVKEAEVHQNPIASGSTERPRAPSSEAIDIPEDASQETEAAKATTGEAAHAAGVVSI